MAPLIRVATADDFAALHQVFVDAIQITAAAHYSAAQRDAWSQRPPGAPSWDARLAPLEVRLAEDGEGVLGFLAFTWEGYIDLLFTAPRAGRRGVATALWRRVEGELVQRGVAEASTLASLVARPLFERQGFVVVQEDVAHLQGQDLTRFAMRRSLEGGPTPPDAPRPG